MIWGKGGDFMPKIGDFVTSYSVGYWQVVDIKPKLQPRDGLRPADADAPAPGTVLGEWIILKKAFTPKMKPRIAFECVDSAWVAPVGAEVLAEIERAFAADPAFKEKFDRAPVKLLPGIVNCWLCLSDEEAVALRAALSTLPERYTMEELRLHLADYTSRSGERCNYLLNLFMQPWDLTEDFAYIFTGCDLQEL